LPKLAPFRQQLSFWRFRRLNLSGQYDFFIIAGDWAMSAAVNNRPNMWYVHSPLNELWEFKNFIKKNLLSSWKLLPFELWVRFNRFLTRRYSRHVDVWVSNSENSRKRIKRFYYKEAMVINPPVYTKDYRNNSLGELNDSGYFLSVNRLITHKRIDLQLEAFALLPEEKLILVGSYEKGASQFEDYKKYLESIKPDNVEIISWVDNKKLKQLYRGARGFITTARDEDFGLTAVEAFSAGKPVIAPAEGGYLESVINGSTGILIDDIDSAKLVSAILEIKDNLNLDPLFYQSACWERAANFDTAVFIDKIKSAIRQN